VAVPIGSESDVAHYARIRIPSHCFLFVLLCLKYEGRQQHSWPYDFLVVGVYLH